MRMALWCAGTAMGMIALAISACGSDEPDPLLPIGTGGATAGAGGSSGSGASGGSGGVPSSGGAAGVGGGGTGGNGTGGVAHNAGAAGIPNALFFDDFETGDKSHTENGFAWTSGGNNVYVGNDPVTGIPTVPRDGTHSLAFAHRAKPDGEDSTAEQRFTMGSRYDELWFRYDVRIPDNFEHRTQASSANNKWLAVWTDDYEQTGVTFVLEYWPTGDGGSEIAYRWVRDGNRTPGHQGHTAFIVVPADRGTWKTFVVRVRLASGDQSNDGIVQTWAADAGGSLQVVHERLDAPMYATGATGGFASGYMMGWSNAGFSEETIFYVDNFAFSDQSLMTP